MTKLSKKQIQIIGNNIMDDIVSDITNRAKKLEECSSWKDISKNPDNLCPVCNLYKGNKELLLLCDNPFCPYV
jgi:hypothetical protein